MANSTVCLFGRIRSHPAAHDQLEPGATATATATATAADDRSERPPHLFDAELVERVLSSMIVAAGLDAAVSRGR